MAMHHGTIRKYTAAILDLFNDLEVQYRDSNSAIITKKIPVKYSSIDPHKIIGTENLIKLYSPLKHILFFVF